MDEKALQLESEPYLTKEDLGAYNFNVLRSILEAYDFIQIGAGVEVGVFDGGTSYFLLCSFPNLRLLSVDPYLSYHEYDQKRMAAAEATAFSRLDQFGQRSIRIKKTSVEAAAVLPDGSFDFVFIDADHTYEAVVSDIRAWYSKVRKGGLFSGHDFRWPGVKQAVLEFAAREKIKGYFSPAESDIWWFIKP